MDVMLVSKFSSRYTCTPGPVGFCWHPLHATRVLNTCLTMSCSRKINFLIRTLVCTNGPCRRTCTASAEWNLENFRICLPMFLLKALQDSSILSVRIQFSQLSRTTQLSFKNGSSWQQVQSPWKATILPRWKKACLAFFTASSTAIYAARFQDHQNPKHFAASKV